MKKIGADDIMPKQLQFLDVDGYQVITMEDLGLTFKSKSQISSNPLEMFRDLIAVMKNVYQATVFTEEQKGRGYEFLVEMKSYLLAQYQRYLLPSRLINKSDLKLIGKIQIEDYLYTRSCFGVWNFTPEDVFLKESKSQNPR